MKIYKWGREDGINQARHSENCICSLKSWAIEKDCDCELQWLRNNVLDFKSACKNVLENNPCLSTDQKNGLNRAVEKSSPTKETNEN